MSINCVNISGNLTKDAELRTTNETGTAVLNFSVAVNDRRRDANGEWIDHPNFVDCSLFGNRATSLQQFLKKGTKVCILGKLRQSSWVDKETGKNRSAISILVDDIEFMSRRDDNGSASTGAPAHAAHAAVDDDDDDMPF